MALRGREKFNKISNTYFITSTIFNHEKIFNLGDEYNWIVINSLKHLLKKMRVSLYAYVIMPTHIHLLEHLPKGESVSDFMRDFKHFTALEIRNLLASNRNFGMLEKLKIQAKGYKEQKYKIWMDRFDDVIVTSEKVFKIKIDYIHFNPVKAGLVMEMEDWKFSSYRNYKYNDNSIIEVKTDLRFED